MSAEVAWDRERARCDPPSIVAMIEAQVSRCPEKIAITDETGEMSYREFDRRANGLANLLIARGATTGEIIGVRLPRSRDLLVTAIAVMKAGCAYMPMDPDYPAARHRHMLECSRARMTIVERRTDGPPDEGIISLEDEAALAPATTRSPGVAIGSGDPAYAIFTSGSSGKPKGVLATHGSAVNRILAQPELQRIGPDEAWLQKTSIGFVDSIYEIFCALALGIRLCIAPPRASNNPKALTDLVAAHDVTRWVTVPALARLLLDLDLVARPLRSLRNWALSGEALDAGLARRLVEALPECEFVNIYGSSEVAADATAYRIEGSEDTVPIGLPLRNVTARILDQRMLPVPTGQIGQLFIGGAGLATGYIGRPDLTAARFVPDPQDPRGRLFRTGDLARADDRGLLYYAGRRDQQVNLHGQRIELGEIEAALLAHPAVRQAAVFVAGSGSLDHRLLAFVEPADGNQIDGRDLIAALAETLPAYMIPRQYVVVESMPLNASGKVDRRTLAIRPEIGRGSVEGVPALNEADCEKCFTIIIGPRGDVAVWPSIAEVPPGWRTASRPQAEAECLEEIRRAADGTSELPR